MRKTIACITALSLLVMVVPSAVAVHSSHVAVKACGSYTYTSPDGDTTSGSDTVGVEINPFYRVIHEPDPDEWQKGADAFAQDIQNGSENPDNDGAIWDTGEDPIDGNGFIHVSLIEGFEEVVGVGTDDTDPAWDTTCE